jgi:hypothetical protein
VVADQVTLNGICSIIESPRMECVCESSHLELNKFINCVTWKHKVLMLVSRSEVNLSDESALFRIRCFTCHSLVQMTGDRDDFRNFQQNSMKKNFFFQTHVFLTNVLESSFVKDFHQIKIILGNTSIKKVRVIACSWWHFCVFRTAWSLSRLSQPTPCLRPPPPPTRPQ